MSRQEICEKIAPMVLEFQNECRKMSKEEFDSFSEEVMKAVAKSDLSRKFMAAVFDVIQKNIFEKETKTA